jgi:hypothetical protein
VDSKHSKEGQPGHQKQGPESAPSPPYPVRWNRQMPRIHTARKGARDLSPQVCGLTIFSPLKEWLTRLVVGRGTCCLHWKACGSTESTHPDAVIPKVNSSISSLTRTAPDESIWPAEISGSGSFAVYAQELAISSAGWETSALISYTGEFPGQSKCLFVHRGQ